MNKLYKIYTLTNMITGEKYVGLSGQYSLNNRINRGYRPTTKIGKAILKYKKENFKLDIIQTTKSKEEAEKLEKIYIEKYDTINNGYNICSGGYINKENIDQSKKVLCVELNRIFKSVKEAKQQLNIKGIHIGDACNGIRKTCEGYHWKFIEEVIYNG